MEKNKNYNKCYLRCLENAHEPIELPDGIETFVGRSKLTNIIDLHCAKQQISLTPDYKNGMVALIQRGLNNSGLNGFKILRNQKHDVHDGDRIELLLNRYTYAIEFKKVGGTKRSSSSNNSQEQDLIDIRTSKQPKLDLPANEDQWEHVHNNELLIFTKKGVYNSDKVAAFDMDGTLIKTISGRVFAKDYNDWQISFAEVPKKLKSLVDNGYKIIIFTNQAGISTGKTDMRSFKTKVENIIKRLGCPIQAFVSTCRGKFRKPLTGMWDALVEKNGGIAIDKTNSFYCGDAAGRPEKWAVGKKKDFSLADRLLAANLNIQFHTPEEYFQGSKPAPWNKPPFDPHLVSTDIPIFEPTNVVCPSTKQEVIVLVGFPGSGKSSFTENYLSNYDKVNQDTLGSINKCIANMKESLQRGRSVVIDNTNLDVETRRQYIQNCGKVPIRCGHLHATVSHCRHNNLFRGLTNPKRVPLGEAVYHSAVKKYKPPSVAEGFVEVFKINFKPNFQKDEHREKYYQYLLD